MLPPRWRCSHSLAVSDAHVLDFGKSIEDHRLSQAGDSSRRVDPSNRSQVNRPAVQTPLPYPYTPPPQYKQSPTPVSAREPSPSQTGRAYSDSMSTIRSGGSAEHIVNPAPSADTLSLPSATRRIRRYTLPQQPSCCRLTNPIRRHLRLCFWRRSHTLWSPRHSPHAP